MKTMKKGFTFLGLLAVMLLGACGPEQASTNPTSSTGTSDTGKSSSSAAQDEGVFVVNFRGEEYEEDATLALTVADNTAQLVPVMLDESEDGTFTFESSDPSVVVAASNGLLTLKKEGSAVITITETGSKEAIKFTINVSNAAVATNGHLYAGVDYEEKARILATLEKYVVDNYLTGITIFSNGGKVCYNTRYKPQVNQYISGYGWGTVREGSFSAPLTKSLTKKPDYYNVGTTSLPSHANAMNASGSDVSTVYDYIASAYYATRMSYDGTSYEWYPSLAIDDAPVAVAEPTVDAATGVVTQPGAILTDASGSTHKRWRIHLKSGNKYNGQKPVYRTASTIDGISSYNNKEVALADYITPLQFMLTAWNGQYRGAELTDGSSAFEGAADYYGNTSNKPTGSNAIFDETLWNKYMGKNLYVGTDEVGDFIEFNLLNDVTPFYAMYNLSSSLYSPLPAAFIQKWGGSVLGKFDNASSASPVDTMLSTGPFYIEEWKDGQDILFKKNENYFHQKDQFKTIVNGQETIQEKDCYKIAGISYFKVADSSALKNHFLSGGIDSYGPTAAEMKAGAEFANNTGDGNGMSWQKYDTLGDSNFKLNVNAANESQWIERFGPTGSIYQHGGATEYKTSTWKMLNKNLQGKKPTTAVKPYMSNIHFLNFLSASIDRKSISEGRGSIPTQEYFSDNYIIDPEKGTSYNSTEAHKAVLADRYNETYGFNKTYAEAELRKAIDEVIEPLAENGAFTTKSGGTASNRNPYIVPLDMEWMNSNDKTDYSDVFENIEKFFKEVVDDDYAGQYALDITQTNGNSDYQEVYNLMRRGEFDLGFGSISGNSLDPINFLEVLKSDNSSGFTLNWGPDTSKVGDGLYSGDDANKNKIVYDGKEWSFDSLWNAATTGVLLDSKGSIANVANASATSADPKAYSKKNDTDQSVTYKLSFKTLIEGGAKEIKIQFTNASGNTSNLETVYIEGGSENYEEKEFTVTKEFNKDENDEKVTIVTFKVNYTVELQDAASQKTVKKEFKTNLILPTYVGL